MKLDESCNYYSTDIHQNSRFSPDYVQTNNNLTVVKPDLCAASTCPRHVDRLSYSLTIRQETRFVAHAWHAFQSYVEKVFSKCDFRPPRHSPNLQEARGWEPAGKNRFPVVKALTDIRFILLWYLFNLKRVCLLYRHTLILTISYQFSTLFIVLSMHLILVLWRMGPYMSHTWSK